MKKIVRFDYDDSEYTPQHSTWAVSYADLVTLLLCFFILFFNVDQTKTKKDPPTEVKAKPPLEIIREKLKANENLSANRTNSTLETLKSKDIDPKALTPADGKQSIEPRIPEGLSLLWEKFKSNPLVKIESSGDFVTLQIAQVEFFNRGSINLTRQGKDQIKRVFEVIEQNKRNILVEIIGHSDNIPVKKRVTLNGMSYSSNLELSTLRAMNVIGYMNGLGMPLENIVIAGHSNSKPIEEMLDLTPSSTNLTGFERRVSFTIRIKR